MNKELIFIKGDIDYKRSIPPNFLTYQTHAVVNLKPNQSNIVVSEV